MCSLQLCSHDFYSERVSRILYAVLRIMIRAVWIAVGEQVHVKDEGQLTLKTPCARSQDVSPELQWLQYRYKPSSPLFRSLPPSRSIDSIRILFSSMEKLVPATSNFCSHNIRIFSNLTIHSVAKIVLDIDRIVDHEIVNGKKFFF